MAPVVACVRYPDGFRDPENEPLPPGEEPVLMIAEGGIPPMDEPPLPRAGCIPDLGRPRPPSAMVWPPPDRPREWMYDFT